MSSKIFCLSKFLFLIFALVLVFPFFCFNVDSIHALGFGCGNNYGYIGCWGQCPGQGGEYRSWSPGIRRVGTVEYDQQEASGSYEYNCCCAERDYEQCSCSSYDCNCTTDDEGTETCDTCWSCSWEHEGTIHRSRMDTDCTIKLPSDSGTTCSGGSSPTGSGDHRWSIDGTTGNHSCSNYVACLECDCRCAVGSLSNPTISDDWGTQTQDSNTGNPCRTDANFYCPGLCEPDRSDCYSDFGVDCDDDFTAYLPEYDPEPPEPEDISIWIRRLSSKSGSADLREDETLRVPFPDYRSTLSYRFRAHSDQDKNPRYVEEDPFDGKTIHYAEWENEVPPSWSGSAWCGEQGNSDAGHTAATVSSDEMASGADGGDGKTYVGGGGKDFGQTYSTDHTFIFNGGSETSIYVRDNNYWPQEELEEGRIYTIEAIAQSQDRCDGHTSGGSITRDFETNYKPEVKEIIPVTSDGNEDPEQANPNDRLSGNRDRDASKYKGEGLKYDINSGDLDEAGFDCDIDNPAYFKVVFEDQNGCEDIDPDSNKPTNIYPEFEEERRVRLRANPTQGGDGVIEGDLDETYCNGNQLKAIFSITFEGIEPSVNYYDLEAKAQDILGNRTYENGSFWVQPSSEDTWAYSSRVEGESLDVSEVDGEARQLELEWSAEDHFGIRFIRPYAALNADDAILTDPAEYSEIVYSNPDDRELDVNQGFREYWVANYSHNNSNTGHIRDEFKPQLTNISDVDEVDIVRNHDGRLDFEIVAVDRACNYTSVQTEQNLGVPWVATRGGLVYSRGDINLPTGTDHVNYQNLNLQKFKDSDFAPDEQTGLGTEWVASGDDSMSFERSGFEYESSNYINRIWQEKVQTSSFYEQLQELADLRGFDYYGPSGDMNTSNVDCHEEQKVYFVDGDLEVYPEDFDGSVIGTRNNGCIFVVSGDITLAEQDGVSAEAQTQGDGAPYYNIVEGFFIADGEINVDFVQEDESRRDGLKVVGSLIAGSGGVDKEEHIYGSIRLRRTLQLEDNMQYPTLIIFHDPRYMDIAKEAFGSTLGGGHIRDVGWME